MSQYQARMVNIAAQHDCAASALPDGSILLESSCVRQGDVYTSTDRVETVRDLFIILGY